MHFAGASTMVGVRNQPWVGSVTGGGTIVAIIR